YRNGTRQFDARRKSGVEQRFGKKSLGGRVSKTENPRRERCDVGRRVRKILEIPQTRDNARRRVRGDGGISRTSKGLDPVGQKYTEPLGQHLLRYVFRAKNFL